MQKSRTLTLSVLLIAITGFAQTQQVLRLVEQPDDRRGFDRRGDIPAVDRFPDVLCGQNDGGEFQEHAPHWNDGRGGARRIALGFRQRNG
jgi:hypothetical protein